VRRTRVFANHSSRPSIRSQNLEINHPDRGSVSNPSINSLKVKYSSIHRSDNLVARVS
jgi:hypothetical protein